MKFDLISFVLGALFSGLGFFLTYKPRWRNCITREFKAKLFQGTCRIHETAFTTLQLILEVTCTHAEDVEIITFYLKYSKDTHGYGPDGQVIKGYDFRQTQSYLWRNYQDSKPLILNKYMKIQLDVRRELLQQINEKVITYMYVVVRSNKYGTITSNKLKFRYPKVVA